MNILDICAAEIAGVKGFDGAFGPIGGELTAKVERLQNSVYGISNAPKTVTHIKWANAAGVYAGGEIADKIFAQGIMPQTCCFCASQGLSRDAVLPAESAFGTSARAVFVFSKGDCYSILWAGHGGLSWRRRRQSPDCIPKHGTCRAPGHSAAERQQQRQTSPHPSLPKP